MEPGRGWTITSGAWIFLKKKERWKGCEQELITTIRKYAEQMEEKEEAGYRSPTWKILRALQQVNKATRIEGEAIMSAPPLFESAGRGDLEFWGVVEGPTVIIWENLSELEKKNWLKNKMSTSKDWVVWCNSKKEGKEDHRFEHHGKKHFSSYDKKKSKVGDEQGKKKKKKAGESVRYRSWWKQGNIKMAASKNYTNCWVHKDFLYQPIM